MMRWVESEVPNQRHAAKCFVENSSSHERRRHTPVINSLRNIYNYINIHYKDNTQMDWKKWRVWHQTATMRMPNWSEEVGIVDPTQT